MEHEINLSVGDEPRILLRLDGWPNERKGDFLDQIRGRQGVVSVATAGGNSSAYVYFDPAVVQRPNLDAAIRKIADEVLPGHNWTS